MVGTLVLISLIVVVIGVIAVGWFSQPAPHKVPAIAVSITNQSAIIKISHEGGDPVPWSELSVLVDDVKYDYSHGAGYGDSWSIGEDLTIDYSAHPNFPNKVDLVFNVTGTQQMILTSKYLGTMTPTPTPVAPPTPTATATTPSVPAPVASFIANVTSGTVPLAVQFNDTSINNPTLWTWEFGDGVTSNSRDPLHVYPFTGMYTVNLTVTNPGGNTSISRTGYITASLSAPTVTAINPNTSLMVNPVSVSITGTGFLSGANVTLVKGGQTDRIASSVNVVNGSHITCQFNVLTAAAGPWDVKVNNTNGLSGTRVSGFIVKTPTPTFTSITNTTGVRGWTIVERINGGNFLSGADVRLVNASAGPDITATNVVVVSATQINGYFDLTGALPARRNVTVKNLYSDTGTYANSFTVTSNAPTVSAFTQTANRGWPAVRPSIAGTGFQPGAQVRLTRTGQPDIIASGATVTSPTTITAATFDLLGVYVGSGTTGTSTWRVNVTNTFDGRSGSAGTFTVSSPRPTFSSITPATAARGSVVSITNLVGTGFQPGATIQLRNATRVISTASGVNVASPNQITCQFTIPSNGVRPGANAYYINVTNTDGRTRNSGSIFTVT